MDPPPSTTGMDEASSEGRERVLTATVAAPGVAVGTAARYDASAPVASRSSIAPDEVDAEIALFDAAVARAEQELKAVGALLPTAAADEAQTLLDAQALMLRDEDFLGAVRRRIRETHASAGAAVQAVLNVPRERMEASDDAYLRDRADELVSLEKRLLRALRRGEAALAVDAHAVLIARALTATDLLRLSRHRLLGCVTEEGSAASHLAVVAEALQIPLLVGVPRVFRAVPSGTPVLVDGEAGRLIVHPTAHTREQYRRRDRDLTTAPETPPDGPPTTADDCAVTVRANIGLESELELLAPYGAQGIGLLRTELYVRGDAGLPLAEDEQAEAYRRALDAAGEAGATVRLLDVGGDDRLPRRSCGLHEDNPMLGWRGVRRLLDCPDELLRPQLRALLRARSRDTLRVLLPMVTNPEEVRRVRAVAAEEHARLPAAVHAPDSALPLGAMVEVPAAALQADALAETVDFLSVGTNDLAQFVLAVDRTNERVAARHSALHPAVLQLVQRVVGAGRAADCPVEVCGEAAADVEAVPVLLGLGVEALSVAPPHLLRVRRLLHAIRHADTPSLARDALAAPDAAAVRAHARGWLRKQGGAAASMLQNP